MFDSTTNYDLGLCKVCTIVPTPNLVTEKFNQVYLCNQVCDKFCDEFPDHPPCPSSLFPTTFLSVCTRFVPYSTFSSHHQLNLYCKYAANSTVNKFVAPNHSPGLCSRCLYDGSVHRNITKTTPRLPSHQV
jgi:hypothetical protein